MTRRMLKTPDGKKIVTNSETDTELYQTDIHGAPYSLRVEEFRVLVHETAHGKYLYIRRQASTDEWYTTRILTASEVVADIHAALSDVDISEKAWPTEDEIKKLLSYGIDVFGDVEQ